MRTGLLAVIFLCAAGAPAAGQIPLRPIPVEPAVPETGVSPVPHRIVPQEVECPKPPVDSSTTTDTPAFIVVEVTRPPELIKAGKRRYPSDLERNMVGGRVQFSFIVDTLGHPEPCSFRALYATNTSFEVAAFWMVLASRYRPGEINGRPVRTVVKQSVRFNP
jgi:hypothetical protein